MATIAELQQKLLSEIAAAVTQYGFGPKPKGQSFRMKTPFGWASVHLAFITHEPSDFDITVDVSLRIDAVENLIHEEDNLLSRAEKLQTATIGCELGNMSEGRQKRWNIASDEAVKQVSESIRNAIVSIALPYIERYSNLEDALDALSSNDKSGWLHSPIHDARCRRALALAFVLGKHDQVKGIIGRNEKFLKSRNDGGLAAFQSLANKILNKVFSQSDK
jgi:hypothetical protein